MPGPFPGMDPYLEKPSLWPDVHHRLITAIGDALVSQVAPRYYIAIEGRTYIAQVEPPEYLGRPDVSVVSPPREESPRGGVAVLTVPETIVETNTLPVELPFYEEIREAYLEIRDVGTHEVITVIEVLSPTNKQPGEGRREYEAKRRQVLAHRTSLIEIDLLRVGEPMAMKPIPSVHYRILISPGWTRPRAWVYGFSLREPIPLVWVPLRREEKGAELPLGALFKEVYDRARYDLRIDYRQPPQPPLSAEDAAWSEITVQRVSHHQDTKTPRKTERKAGHPRIHRR